MICISIQITLILSIANQEFLRDFRRFTSQTIFSMIDNTINRLAGPSHLAPSPFFSLDRRTGPSF